MTTLIKQDDLIESVAAALQYISYYHPADYIAHLARAYEREQSPAAKDAIAQILTNSKMSATGHRPICQDTGMPTFFIHTPVGFNQLRLRDELLAAIAEASGAPSRTCTSASMASARMARLPSVSAAACSSADMVGTPLNQVIRSCSISRRASWGSHLCMITILRPTTSDNIKAE